jgi:vitamin B12 transporter
MVSRIWLVVALVAGSVPAGYGLALADSGSAASGAVAAFSPASSAAPSGAKKSLAPASPKGPPAKAGLNAKPSAAKNKQSAPATLAQSAAQLPTYVVTATRIEQPINEVGATISVVSDHQIESQKIQQTADVLTQVPGVHVTTSGSPGAITDVSIRGATPAQTLVLVDGVEVNSGQTGAFDFANLTTNNLEQIEVLRGAGGSLYGSQAVGGVVNLISREGAGAPQFTLLSQGGTRATQLQVGSFQGSIDRLGYSGAISYGSTTGFRPINDSSDNLAGNVRLDYHLTGDTIFRGFARYSTSNVSLVNFSVFSGSPIDPDAHQRTEFMLFKGEIEHRFSDHLTVKWSGSFVRTELRINNFPDAANPSSEDDDDPDEIRGTNLEAVYSWTRNFTTLAGFDFKDRWTRSGENAIFFGAPSSRQFHADRQEYAGYLEQQGAFFDGHLLATGGFRVDGNSDFGKEVSPSWSVAFPISKIDATLRGSYSEGFRAPSFDDLFFPDFGNPNLKPEISSEYDGGFTKQFGELASITTTFFSRRVKDLVVAVPCASCVFGSQAGNAGRVDTQGVEVVPQIQIRRFTLGGNFTALDETHVSSSPSIRPLRVPKHSASALLEYSQPAVFLPLDKIDFNLAYTFVGDRDDIDTSSNIRNHVGYQLFNGVVSYSGGLRWNRIRNEQAFVRLQNIFDRNYADAFGFKSPPINFVGGVKLDF